MDQPSYPTQPYVPWPFLGPPQGPDEIGRLAQYRILKPLGQGGMGIVFQAEDEQLGRPAALKVMRPEFAAQDDARERFLREARAAAQLKHDHVVTIYQVAEHNGVPFLAMEFLAGKSLEEWLRPDRRVTVPEALNLGRQIAKGLAAAHAKGLVHRDIKPANLWVEAPRGRVKVLDFGLARQSAGELPALTHTGALLGTPAYMAPEQARGDVVDHRSDLFSLGCVLYRMVTGRLPFQGSTTYAVLTAIATETPPPVRDLNPAVPERLAALIERLLAKDPRDRPASAQAVFDELQAIDKEMKARPAPAAVAEPAGIAPDLVFIDQPGRRPASRGRRWLAPVGATVAAVLVAAIGLATWKPWRGKSPSPEPVPAKEEPAALTGKGAPTSTPAVAAPVDLLALIDIPRDCRKGMCMPQRGGGLRLRTVNGPEGSNLRLPWEPPTRYRLKLTAIRETDENAQLGLHLIFDTGPAFFVIDWYDGRDYFTGFASINGYNNLPERSDAWRGLVLTKLPMRLAFTVEPGDTRLEVNGRQIYHWSGDEKSLSITGKSRVLQLVGFRTADFVFKEITLEPLGPDAGRLALPKK